ncbi:MAG: oligosaccharide flippase family protein [Anaerolineae bacterium]|nr:oligosaccharide flippase family protein [Anaerolineae bacterium]
MRASSSGPTERVAVGSVANVLGYATTTILALLLTPYLLRRLGAGTFGAWALVGVIVSALQLADLGLPRALSRAVAGACAQDDTASLGAALSTALSLYLIVGSAVALLLVVVREPLVTYGLAVPEPWRADASVALVWLALGLLPTLIAGALGATLDGFQRMEWTNLALVAGRATYAVGALVAVLSGNGLRGLAIALACAAFCQLAVAAVGLWVSHKNCLPFKQGEGRWGLAGLVHPSLVAARSLLFYGLPILVSAVVGLAYVPWSKLVLARAAPVEMVGYYEVASTFAMQVFFLSWALAMAAFPALAQAWKMSDHDHTRWLYSRANRWGALAVFPAGIALVVVAAPLLRAWLGLGTTDAVRALQLVAAGWTLVAMAAPSAVTLQAIGRPGHTLYAVLVNGLTSAILCLILAPRYKLVGVAAANLASAVASSLLMIWLCRRALGLPALPGAATFLRPAASALWTPVVPALLLTLASIAIARQPSPSLVALFLAGGGYAVLYAVCCFAWGPLAEEERSWLRRHLLPLPFGERPG